MLSSLLAIVLLVALVWNITRLVTSPSDKLLQAVSFCLVCATLSFPVGTRGGAGFVDALIGEGTAKLLQNVFLLGAVFFLKCFFIHSVSDRETGRARVRAELVPLGITILVITAAMAATPQAERSHTYAAANMRADGVAVFYLTAGLYLMYALAVALCWTVRYARVSGRPLVTGLWLIAGALTAMVSAAAVREVLTLVRWLGGEVPRPAILGAKLLLDLAIPLFVIGVLYPASATRWASLRLWWHHRRVYRRLAPLWSALNQVFPEDALHRGHPSWRDSWSLRGVHRRYYRRAIECRDGLVRISPHLALLEAEEHPSTGELAIESTARHLRAALAAYAAGEPAPSQAVPIALPHGDSLEDDVRQLALLADAL